MESTLSSTEPEISSTAAGADSNASAALPTPEDLMVPLMNNSISTSTTTTAPSTNTTKTRSSSSTEEQSNNIVRRASTRTPAIHTRLDKRRTKRRTNISKNSSISKRKRQFCGCNTNYMNVVARILVWASVISLSLGVIWYSYELTKHGTDPHLIAWFSAGAFVLLGFPISMYGIISHLANYNEPTIQCYVVRILWMVPIYSMESWLCLRFHKYAIYIETLRDCYESYVLYCFLQFLIQVLGGEDELVNMLRTKSPTRGVHMWGLQWCVRPWLMGQPLSRGLGNVVQWTSPFFVKCKFGVLQYVLLKFVSSIFVMILELKHLYKEGDFTPKGGYLYICILTNVSQCWALYCLIFFYYATKNELGPIRPVGKFLSVKALVFFTWWQSVGISLVYQMGMIPHYHAKEEWTSEDVAKGLQDYLICIEMFLAAIVHVFVFPHTDYLASSRRKLLIGGSRHSQQNKRLGRRKILGGGKYGYAPWKHSHSGDADSRSSKNSGYDYDLELASHASSDAIIHSSSSGLSPKPTVVREEQNTETNTSSSLLQLGDAAEGSNEPLPLMPLSLREEDDEEEDGDESDEEGDYTGEEEDSPVSTRPTRPGFVSALLDSTIPRDVVDNTAGIVKGAYHVEKRTLLHHATTADQYDLFRTSRFAAHGKKSQQQPERPPPP